jgi:hypothetical protein
MPVKGLQKGAELVGKGAKAGGERLFEGVQNKLGVDLDPRLWKESLKKYNADNKKKRLENRYKDGLVKNGRGQASSLIQTYDPLSKANWKRWGNLAKYSAATNQFAGAKFWRKQKEGADERSKIKLDSERDTLATEMSSLAAQRTLAERGKNQFSHSGIVDADIAESVSKRLGSNITNLRNKASEANSEADELESEGLLREAEAKRLEARDFEAQALRQEAVKTSIDTQVAAGAHTVSFTGAAPDVQTEIAEFLDKEPTKINEEITKKTTEAAEDDTRRVAQGFSAYAPAAARTAGYKGFEARNKAAAEKDVKDFTEAANKTARPESRYETDLRLKNVSEQSKVISEVEDPGELLDRFDEAMAKNNAPLAEAIAKKMAKSGAFGDILAKYGKNADYEGFRKFMEDDFGKLVGNKNELRKIASEIAGINLANKAYNMAFMTKVNNRQVEWVNKDDHYKKMSEKMAKASVSETLRTLGAGNYVNKDASGARSFQKGGVQFLRQISESNAQDHLISHPKMSPYVAKEIVQVPNWENELLGAGVNRKVIEGIKKSVSR